LSARTARLASPSIVTRSSRSIAASPSFPFISPCPSLFGQAFSEGQVLAYGYDFEQATKARVLPKHTPALPSDVLRMDAARIANVRF
jgi:hypothetical protein